MGTVLVVDDNTRNLQLLAQIVQECGYEPVMAMGGGQALEYLKEEKPDLVLLDVMMPDIDGYSVCKTIKSYPDLVDLPIIFLTARNESDDVVKGFEVGGIDYISKPFNTVELKARLKTHMDLKKSNDQIRSYIEKLDHAAKTDPLTGLYNRRYLLEKIDQELRQFKSTTKVFSLLIADIDFFKQINDRYGHTCGDNILSAVSARLASVCREADTLARWGGEEFLLLLPNTDQTIALKVAERLRKMVEDQVIPYNEHRISVTITCGVATFNGDENIDELISRADNLLYLGKERGRNQVVSD